MYKKKKKKKILGTKWGSQDWMSGEAKFISDKYIQVLETNLNFIEKKIM